MSHPHLEDLVSDDLDSPITAPDELDPDITVDREKFTSQLQLVQRILKKERDKLKPSPPNSEPGCSSSPKTSKKATKRAKTPEKTHSDESAGARKKFKKDDEESIAEYYRKTDDPEKREMARTRTIAKLKSIGEKVVLAPRGEFALKHALSAPYHVFFTRVLDEVATYSEDHSVTMPEILDKSLGEIESSLHFNFIIDIAWLMIQYILATQKNDMLLILGDRADGSRDPKGRPMFDDLTPNVKVLLKDKMPTPYGIHHSKVSVLKYVDGGIRVVVSTANLYPDDWKNRTQGMWISPHLPPLPDNAVPSDGESPTGFKRDFEKYLLAYNDSVLSDWIHHVRRADFAAVNVFFVASVPGSHKGTELHAWGHRKLGKVLSQHATLPPNAPYWPIVGVSSSIGSLGPNYGAWLTTDIVPCMSMEVERGLKAMPEFRFVYPSMEDYKASYDCRDLISCLPYSMKWHSKQTWFENYMHRWKSSEMNRTKAMPHIKCYTRISPGMKEIPWLVLTSANLSKAAWGSGKMSHYVLNYEVGVVFIPKFVVKAKTFPIKSQQSPDVPIFPIPYDLPLKKYSGNDKPFVAEFFQE